MRDDGDMAAERNAEGRSASATTRRIGAENNSREINIAISTNKVLIHLGTASADLLNVFSSLENPIAAGIALLSVRALCVSGDAEREKGRKRG